MSLLLQLNADLQQHFPHDERRLHVLCCRKKTCSKKIGSVRAFREVRKGKTMERKEKPSSTQGATKLSANGPAQDLGSALFGTSTSIPLSHSSNPFAHPRAGEAHSPAMNPFSSLPPPSTLAAKPPQRPADEIHLPSETFAEKLRISSDSTSQADSAGRADPWPKQSEFPPPFPYFYLDAYPEDLDASLTRAVAGPSTSEYDADDSGASNAVDRDTFESSLDKTFQKFSDRIAQNPEQVLRYEFQGQPLLYSGSDGVASRFVVPHGKAGAVRGIPRCENCGAQRVFELQLVPGLIYELEKDDVMDLEDGMEWGTIIVGSCANNCGELGKISFREEWVGVQWEEGVARKK